MKHEVPWNDQGVKAVFNQWRELAAYCRPGANGRIWQDAAKALENKQAAHDVPGHQPGAPRTTPVETWPTWTSSRSRRSTRSTATDSMDAPTDGFMLTRRSRTSPARRILEYIGTARRRRRS